MNGNGFGNKRQFRHKISPFCRCAAAQNDGEIPVSLATKMG
jgi:hypothetical protein